jgi:hypothetical protein
MAGRRGHASRVLDDDAGMDSSGARRLRQRIGSRAGVVAIAVLVVAASAAAAGGWLVLGNRPSATGAPSASSTGGGATTLPALDSIYVIVLENQSGNDVIRSHSMPYLASLIARGAVATGYRAITHPSQPNYLALFSGDTQGVTDDNLHDLSAPNLADQLDARSRRWSVSAENLPDSSFTGETATGGRDGPGTYVRKHEPAISFTSIGRDPLRRANIHDLTAFDPRTGGFQLIIPNLCHDGHDCPLDTVDAFLSGFVPRILDSPGFDRGGVLFIIADEGERQNIVPLVAVGHGIIAGTSRADAWDHDSLLRSVEDAWDLGCLANACRATTLAALFTPGASP